MNATRITFLYYYAFGVVKVGLLQLAKPEIIKLHLILTKKLHFR